MELQGKRGQRWRKRQNSQENLAKWKENTKKRRKTHGKPKKRKKIQKKTKKIPKLTSRPFSHKAMNFWCWVCASSRFPSDFKRFCFLRVLSPNDVLFMYLILSGQHLRPQNSFPSTYSNRKHRTGWFYERKTNKLIFLWTWWNGLVFIT